jgi:hypothetical protein
MPHKGIEAAVNRAFEVGQGHSGHWEVTLTNWTATLYHYDNRVALAVGTGEDAHLSVEREPRPGGGLSVSDKRGIRAFFEAIRAPSDHIKIAFEQGFWSKYEKKPKVLKLGKRMRVIPIILDEPDAKEFSPDWSGE